jgi:hypothetical protein
VALFLLPKRIFDAGDVVGVEDLIAADWRIIEPALCVARVFSEPFQHPAAGFPHCLRSLVKG